MWKASDAAMARSLWAVRPCRCCPPGCSKQAATVPLDALGSDLRPAQARWVNEGGMTVALLVQDSSLLEALIEQPARPPGFPRRIDPREKRRRASPAPGGILF